MGYYPENTLTNFMTRLPNPIDLQGDWEVGLVEIQYPHNWYNVPHEVSHRTFQMESGNIRTSFTIRSGNYPSISRLVTKIQGKMNDCFPNGHGHVELSYDDVIDKVKGDFNAAVKLEVPIHIQKILGMRSTTLEVGLNENWVADDVADLDTVDSLYVYCDVVQPRVVGDSQVPLLRIVPVEGKHGDLVTRIYENVHYVRVQKKNFQSMEINIRDRTGQKVPFERGTLNVTLHFRQRKRLSTL